MGGVNAAIKALEAKQDETAKELKSSLQMLGALADSKKRELKAEIEQQMTQAMQDAKHSNNQVPPGLTLYEFGETHVSTSQGPATGITSAINGLLSNPAENWKKAISDLAGVALNALLGAGGGSSTNSNLYMIAVDGHPAAEGVEDTQVVVRIDYSLWVYNFASTGVKEVAESAIAYFARKSLIDYMHITDNLTIDQLLKSMGLKKDMRDQLIEQIGKEKANQGRPPALAAYLRSQPEQVRVAARVLYAL